MHILRKIVWAVALLLNTVSGWAVLQSLAGLAASGSYLGIAAISPVVIMLSVVSTCFAFCFDAFTRP